MAVQLRPAYAGTSAKVSGWTANCFSLSACQTYSYVHRLYNNYCVAVDAINVSQLCAAPIDVSVDYEHPLCRCPNSFEACQLVEPDCLTPPCLPVPRCMSTARHRGNVVLARNRSYFRSRQSVPQWSTYDSFRKWRNRAMQSFNAMHRQLLVPHGA